MKGQIMYKVIASQDIHKGQTIAVNKDGTVRRTNRKKYAVGVAISEGTKGKELFIQA